MKRREVLAAVAAAGAGTLVGFPEVARAQKPEFLGLEIRLDVEPGDCRSEYIRGPKYSGPSSKLIDKLKACRVVFEQDRPVEGSKVEFRFYEEDGSPWLGIDEPAEVEADVLFKDQRWAVIDRAIVLLKGHEMRRLRGEPIKTYDGRMVFPKGAELWPTWRDFAAWGNEQRDKIRSVVVSMLIYNDGLIG